MWTKVMMCAVLASVPALAQTAPTVDAKGKPQEVSAALKPVRFELSADEQRRLTEAAVNFARQIDQDQNDSQFVTLARGALSTSVQAAAFKRFGRHLTADELGVRGLGVLVADDGGGMWQASLFWEDPGGARNAKKLFELAASQPGIKIIGGEDDTARVLGEDDKPNPMLPQDYFPDCVAVGSERGWCCSGVLVAPNVVLTAGHCFSGCAEYVFFGEAICRPGRMYSVKSAVRHPNYVDGPDYLNDLTVLILDMDVPESVGKPRKLASREAVRNAFAGRVVGFGANEPSGRAGYGTRRKATVVVVSNECDPNTAAPNKFGCHPKIEMVAGELGSGKDTCRGDSGGPLYVLENGDWTLAATTSRPTRDSKRACGDGGNYVLVLPYLDWIRSVPGGHWN